MDFEIPFNTLQPYKIEPKLRSFDYSFKSCFRSFVPNVKRSLLVHCLDLSTNIKAVQVLSILTLVSTIIAACGPPKTVTETATEAEFNAEGFVYDEKPFVLRGQFRIEN